MEFFQNIIDKIRGKHNINYVSTTAKKIVGMNKVCKKISTLILGSSHMELGYIASEDEYNLATASQDIYTSNELFKIYNSENIKNIIISMSYFYSWHILIKTQYYKYCTFFRLLAGIEYQYPEVAKERGLYEFEKENEHYIKGLLKIYVSRKYRGNYRKFPDGYIGPTEEGKAAILKAMQREKSQLKVLKEFLDNTKDKNVYVVTPPMSADFRAFMQDKKTMYEDLYRELADRPNVKLLDYYDDESFELSDFMDFQHLNLSGAKKLTQKIKENMV